MTRIRRSGVLVVVAMLVLWGGAAAATAASFSATADEPVAPAAAQVQEQNASVTFEDQTADGMTVTVANVTLPEGGYVTIHDSSLLDGETLSSVVGVSEYLEPGTHENVTVTLYEGVPGADFGNVSAPNGTQTFIAMPHMETSTAPTDGNATDGNQTNGNATDGNATDGDGMAQNQTYDFVATNGSEDGPYTVDGEAVVDDAEVTFEGEGPGEPTEPQQPTRGIVVETLTAPASVTLGDNVTVSATVENTADEARTESVAFRLEGQGLDLVFTREVSLDPGVSTTVTFDLDTSLLTEGQYIHGVTTANSSSFALLDATADGGPPDDGAPGNDTTEPGDNVSEPGDNVSEPGDNVSEPGDNVSEPGDNVSQPAQVTFDSQESDGVNVTVNSVTLPEGGYVTIHDETLLDGEVTGSVIGVSEYLEAGTHENVTITLFEVPDGNYDQVMLEQSQTLVAMPHMETGNDQFYDFLTTNGTEDGPYEVDGQPVTDDAAISLDGDDQTTEAPATPTTTELTVTLPETAPTTEAPGNETATTTPGNETTTTTTTTTENDAG